MTSRLSSLRNIGPTTEEWLNEVGIHTVDDLQQVGALAAWRRLKSAFPAAVTLNALYALEAALLDMDWRKLPAERLAELKRLAEEESG
jgi:DNA transformation protein